MILPADTARCAGKPAGPSGHQPHPECQECARRLAPRGGYTVRQAPDESPCPLRIAAAAIVDHRTGGSVLAPILVREFGERA